MSGSVCLVECFIVPSSVVYSRKIRMVCSSFNILRCLVLSVCIRLSLVLRRTLKLSVVWATITALTSSLVWNVDVKRRDTGLALLPCLVSASWSRNRLLKVLPDCPTYCNRHLWQFITYLV